MRGRVRRAAVVAAVVGAIVTVGCSSADGGSGTPPGPGRSLVMALAEEPENLNPIFGDIYGTIYGDKWPMFSGLVGYGKDLSLRPDLAAELPEVDGTTVRVRLREGAVFHDGHPLTADDVVFTYQSILDPAVATNLRDLL